ncbi:MAG TPA: hypothetical protein EYG85_00900 [Crocinitomix sp.]|nr:hypothetical protein [Crocinitomix sp.]
MNKIIFLILFVLSINIVCSQNVTHSIWGLQGFNRVGFYNDLSYKLSYSNHQLCLGARYYTFDDFFEKNTIGLSLGYDYKIESKSEKIFFFTGVYTSIFNEKKSNAKVNLITAMLTNGIGIKIFNQFAFFYQLGIGVVSNKTTITQYNTTTKYQFYNYEMALGFSYHFNQ